MHFLSTSGLGVHRDVQVCDGQQGKGSPRGLKSEPLLLMELLNFFSGPAEALEQMLRIICSFAPWLFKSSWCEPGIAQGVRDIIVNMTWSPPPPARGSSAAG